MAKVRLYLNQPLGQGQAVDLTRDQAHYLFGVMRLTVGDDVLVFDGLSGEWRATVAEASRKGGVLIPHEHTKPLSVPPDLWLLFAPIKKARTDFIVEKAAELGVAKILPVQTDFTNSDRIRQDRLQAHVVEAAEQCGGTYVPKVEALQSLDTVLGNWPKDRSLLFCDEAGGGAGPDTAFKNTKAPAAILIGPEGGFSDAERARLLGLPFVSPISLGPRILRADTAAVAALTMWQALAGDWQ